MGWTLFSQTPPVVGQGVGPLDFILVLWPATLVSPPLIQLSTISSAVGGGGIGGTSAPYWCALPALPPSTSDTSLAAQIATAKALQAQLGSQGNDVSVLTAAITTLQSAAGASAPTA